MYKLLPCKYLLYIVSFSSIFDRTIFQCIYTVLCACVVNAEVKQEVTLTAPMINDTYRVRLWYTLYFPYAVFFVKLTSIYKWRACDNQISKHISLRLIIRSLLLNIYHIYLLFARTLVLTLTHKSYVLSIYSLATKKTYHDHPEFSTFTIDLLADIDHRP